MRKTTLGITTLLYLVAQGVVAETIITAQDYAVDSDVVLESAVKEVKSIPQDTVNVVGDTVKFVADETVTAANGVAAAFKADPLEKVEKQALIDVANAWDSSNDIIFRSYKVTADVGAQLAEGAVAGESGAIDLSGAFAGVDFPEKSSIYFYPQFNRIMVRNTQANLLKIEDVLGEMHSAEFDTMGKQVEIETKFVEVNQSTLNELGFKWSFDGKDGGSAHVGPLALPAQDIFNQGLRTAATAMGAGTLSDTLAITRATGSLQWSLVINALEQADDTDVLSAPSIVTRDGSEATITVGEERTVSLGFDVSQSESSLFIGHELEARLMGVQLTVTPDLRTDSLIDLKLSPKVVDLIGYDDYQVVPEDAKVKYGGSSISTVNSSGTISWIAPFIGDSVFGNIDGHNVDAGLSSRVPYYRLREMETNVTIADGSTVGLGGLIYDKLETFKDKVPVLGSIPLVGRLFRSEGEKSVKRNLLMFVTATQVDVNGRRASDMALSK